MMKMILCLVFILSIFSAGCGGKDLEYKANLGYGFNNVDYEKLVFRIYNTDKETHKWVHLDSFEIRPEEGKYPDIIAEASKDKVKLILMERSLEANDDSWTYHEKEIDSFELDIDGFEGVVSGFQNFQIKDIKGEQLYRLYPISNKGGAAFLSQIALDEEYNTEGKTLDDILITLEILRD